MFWITIVSATKFEVQGLVSEAKLNIETNIADNIKDNPKAFFSYIRSK